MLTQQYYVFNGQTGHYRRLGFSAKENLLTDVAVSDDVDERMHMRFGGEVNACAHVPQRRIDVCRVVRAQPV